MSPRKETPKVIEKVEKAPVVKDYPASVVKQELKIEVPVIVKDPPKKIKEVPKVIEKVEPKTKETPKIQETVKDPPKAE